MWGPCLKCEACVAWQDLGARLERYALPLCGGDVEDEVAARQADCWLGIDLCGEKDPQVARDDGAAEEVLASRFHLQVAALAARYIAHAVVGAARDVGQAPAPTQGTTSAQVARFQQPRTLKRPLPLR
jgi:hypothetical protein